MKKDRVFYICSYGGSGSKILQRYLDTFGKTFHIHSRFPPNKLCRIGESVYHEHFNDKKLMRMI